jgi:NAD-dependent deacetylase
MSLNIVVLTGSGISKDSGLATFRDAGGLWENHSIENVASIDGWFADREKVLRFYNDRRKQASAAKPNAGHHALVELESDFDVTIITQNVDDLHERAGSSNVIHLHGLLREAKSENDDSIVIDIGSDNILLGDKGPDGAQLRPNVVWFGEPVPAMLRAPEIVASADLFIVTGTSLAVYPAASLVHNTSERARKYLVDPAEVEMNLPEEWKHIKKGASEGLPELVKQLKKTYLNR